MSFQSLQQVLGALAAQYKPQQPEPIQQVLQCWADVVGSIAAAQTRPLSIQRQVLRVATSSSVWAQNLVFERPRILEKLNAYLSLALVDIRFSTAQWTQAQIQTRSPEAEQRQLWQFHPSRLPEEVHLQRSSPEGDDPMAAFENWATLMRSRSQRLPLCPQCHCPAPPGELERWRTCGICAAKQWNS